MNDGSCNAHWEVYTGAVGAAMHDVLPGLQRMRHSGEPDWALASAQVVAASLEAHMDVRASEWAPGSARRMEGHTAPAGNDGARRHGIPGDATTQQSVAERVACVLRNL